MTAMLENFVKKEVCNFFGGAIAATAAHYLAGRQVANLGPFIQSGITAQKGFVVGAAPFIVVILVRFIFDSAVNHCLSKETQDNWHKTLAGIRIGIFLTSFTISYQIAQVQMITAFSLWTITTVGMLIAGNKILKS